jgi:hypothetical protein
MAIRGAILLMDIGGTILLMAIDGYWWLFYYKLLLDILCYIIVGYW